MMLGLRSERVGQAGALGVAALLLGLLWFALACPLSAWYAGRAREIAQREVVAGDLARQGARVPELLARAQALDARTFDPEGPGGAALLTGATDAIAGAALQMALQHLAGNVGVHPTSIEALVAQKAGRYRRIGVGVTLTITWPVLIRLLGAIDLATPRMLVGDLEVRASPFRIENIEQPFGVRLTIFAFRLRQDSAHIAEQPPRGERFARSERVREWVGMALARPLFRTDRRPVQTAEASGGNRGLRLAGIIVSPAGREAIFAGLAGGEPIVARIGGMVAGWTVTKIDSLEVTIKRARLVKILRPAFDATADISYPGGEAGDSEQRWSSASSADIPAITRLLHDSPQ